MGRLAADGSARVDRRLEPSREPRLDRVYEAWRLLQVYGRHACPEPCERELQAVRMATRLLRV